MSIKLHLDVNGPFPDINVKELKERPVDHLYEAIRVWSWASSFICLYFG